MEFNVHWYRVTRRSKKLDWCNVLYAYVDLDSGRILYLGKAGKLRVLDRLNGKDKEDVHRYLADRGFGRWGLIVGNIFLPTETKRFTEKMLLDIESLLIYRLQPPANIKSRSSRGISRPGMRLVCGGDWPLDRAIFVDRG